jgi:hypothetical protein
MVTATGVVAGMTVWLNDGSSESDVTAPAGLQMGGPVVMMLTPKMLGAWHLHARVVDLLGCSTETGLVRNVTVTP